MRRTSLNCASLHRSSAPVADRKSASTSAIVGFPPMSTRLVSTLRTWTTTPFGTTRTGSAFGTVNRPPWETLRCRASRSTSAAALRGQMPR